MADARGAPCFWTSPRLHRSALGRGAELDFWARRLRWHRTRRADCTLSGMPDRRMAGPSAFTFRRLPAEGQPGRRAAEFPLLRRVLSRRFRLLWLAHRETSESRGWTREPAN